MHSELLARLEAATGPDRELDAAIKELVGHAWDYAADWGPRGFEQPVAQPYTGSFDAALTLVPEGWGIAIVTKWMGTTNSKVGLQRSAPFGATEATATTPALAICIAALKARQP